MNKHTTKKNARDTESLVFFGTQGVGPGKGISVARFNSVNGEIGEISLAAETEAPAFLALHPDGHTLYATNSNNFSQQWFSEEMSAFRITPESGTLTLVNKQNCGGRDPNYLSIDRTKKYIIAANYKGGNASSIELLENGSLGRRVSLVQHEGTGFLSDRQNQPYAHCVKISPDNRFALVADLGLDKIYVYRFSESDGSLTPHDPPFFETKPGFGPRHLIFHPDGRFLYITNEMNSSVSVLSWNTETGILSEIQTIKTIPADFSGENACGDITIHPDGKHLFAANRGHDSVTVFSIDSVTGKISFKETVSTIGKKPRNIVFDPAGKWLLVSNQLSDNVTVFRFDQETGHLSPNGDPHPVPNPLGIVFLS